MLHVYILKIARARIYHLVVFCTDIVINATKRNATIILKLTDYYVIVLVGIGLLSGLPGDHHRRSMNNRVH